YSRHVESAMDAAKFTDTNYYESLEELVKDCDALILTVPDGQIETVAKKLQDFGSLMEGKIICHTSGALSSQVFSGMSGCYGYSIHPIYAVSSKTESYINFKECFITIEGHSEYLDVFKCIFAGIGHPVKVISDSDKVKYHSGAVFASNLVIALYKMGTELLEQCGFSEDEAENALKPLFKNNGDRLYETDCRSALTGPVERCDISTVKKHMEVLAEDYKDIYSLLSLKLIEIARHKGEGNYEALESVLKESK
ncbi:MAG: DUF2520 domain-containing protein, partial [Lachnospiraceae bacterium]|nr:DUF2520 domain-containing protein [Lachnospiraceae bacterium]